MKVLALLAVVAFATAVPHQPRGLTAWERIHGVGNKPRITGGQEVTPHSIPFQVGLNIFAEDGTYFCGGSLLSENVVLTAAHCCELTNNITVVLGAHEIRNTNETTQQSIDAVKIDIHPNWDSTNLVNDICLLTLASNATLNDAVKTVSLPTRKEQNDDFSGRIGTASGWGLASDQDTSISPVLRNVNLPVLTNAQCRIKFGIIGVGLPLHPTNVCTDGAEGKSTCSGDSGGPLTVSDSVGKPMVIGLTSFGISLGCEAGYPAVFTRITSYLDWIALQTGIPIDY